MQINSPGGSPTQSELIHNRIKFLSKKTKIKVLAFVEDVAASGGYWIACSAEKIFACKNSVIGSIGVISQSFGFNKMIEKIGVDRRVYTTGDNKSILDPFLPEKESDINLLLSVQRDIYENFKDLVKNNREEIKLENYDEIFSGSFWSAKKSEQLGLIDGINDIYSFLDEEYGEDIKIKKVNFEKSWLKSKLGLSISDATNSILNTVIERHELNKFL